EAVDALVASRAPLPSAQERKRLRQAHGLTLEEVAAALKVRRATVSGWESVKKTVEPQGPEREAYARLLNKLAELYPAPSVPEGAAAPAVPDTFTAAPAPAKAQTLPPSPAPDTATTTATGNTRINPGPPPAALAATPATENPQFNPGPPPPVPSAAPASARTTASTSTSRRPSARR
ncbi:helix-turn-helix domain-containing protein, partial [Streptomyces sp. G35A]